MNECSSVAVGAAPDEIVGVEEVHDLVDRSAFLDGVGDGPPFGERAQTAGVERVLDELVDPGAARSIAAVRPVMPPPTMTTSTSTSVFS